MQTIAFILVIAGLVQFVEMVIKKTSPTLYQALGVYLPLITTNCAVLGVAILNIQSNYNLIETLVHGIAGGLSFTLAIVLFAGVRERLELAPKILGRFPHSDDFSKSVLNCFPWFQRFTQWIVVIIA